MKRSIEDWFTEGIEALAYGKIRRAEKILEQLKKQAPGNLLTIELSGDVARESGNIEEAFEAYRQIADTHNPLSRRAVGYMNLASLHEEQRDVEQALECIGKAIEIYSQLGFDRKRWDAQRYLSEVLLEFGKFSESCSTAQTLLDEIKNHPRRRKFLELAVEVRYQLAESLRFLGRLDESAYHWEKICTLGNKYSWPIELSMGLDGLGVVRQMQGRYEEALKLHNESLEIDRNLRDEEGQSVSLGNLARLHIHLNQWDEAEDYAKQSMEIERRKESILGIAFVNLILAEVDMGRGNYRDAEKRLLQLERLYEREGLTDDSIAVSSQLGVVHRHLGLYDEAEQRQWKVLKLAQEMGHADGVPSTYDELGEIRVAQGKEQEAKEFFEKAIVGFAEIGLDHRVAEVQAKLDLLEGK
jgi:tetratricopeptide (TPR) repeat protein